MSSSPAPQWMDGIPLELRPRYYPKPPLKFKEIDIYIPLDAIENDVSYNYPEDRYYGLLCFIFAYLNSWNLSVSV